MCCNSGPVWSNSWFSCKHGDAIKLKDPALAKGQPLRRSFEAALANAEMKECLNKAGPRACGLCCLGACCRNSEVIANQLNCTWCKETNEKILHTAGFECKAIYWDNGEAGEDHVEHLIIMIMKYAGDSSNSI